MLRIAKRRWLSLAVLASAGCLCALAATAPALGVPQAIRDKQAEAERVLAEIDQIDQRLERAIEAYNGASYRLDQLRVEIKANKRRLAIAKSAFRRAERNLQQRLVTLYTEGDQSTIEIILGASNLDELLDALDAAKRVSSQDIRIIQEITASRQSIVAHERKLEKAEKEQRRLVAERASRKDAIEAQLGERQALYASIKSEIAQLEAQERERARRAREEAERRLAATRATADVVDIPANISTPDGMGTVPPSAYGGGVVGAAMTQLGVPYVWGGASPSGFDCSGLVVWAYAQVGRSGLPHYTGALWQLGVPVSYSQLAPGDLVFFYGGGHMGIYIGGGQFVHAPHTGDVVKVSDMSPGSHYAGSFLGARRI